jgi:hypothetical protein
MQPAPAAIHASVDSAGFSEIAPVDRNKPKTGGCNEK